MQSCKGQENCELLKNGVSILLSKKPLGYSNLTWIVLICVMTVFKPSYLIFPFHGTRKRTCVIAWPSVVTIGGGRPGFALRNSMQKAFLIVRRFFFIGSGSIRNITWVIRIALPKFGCFYFGSSTKNIIHFVNNHFYTFQIKILFLKTVSFLPQLATISSQD